jgi:hypothetical protein
MRCLAWPRSRSIRWTSSPAYHTSIASAPTRASTTSPISRAGTEYVFRFTWIVLPRLTLTRARSSVSSRRAGSGRKWGTSAVAASARAALRRATSATTNCQYASRLAKSRLPRRSRACARASLNRRWACSPSPFSWALAALVASASTP